jgi:hypothetical protein
MEDGVGILSTKLGGGGTFAWDSVRSILISAYGLRVCCLGPFRPGMQ